MSNSSCSSYWCLFYIGADNCGSKKTNSETIKYKKDVNNYSYSKMNGDRTMAKKKLIWYPGAMYHITSRGNRRSDLFKDEEVVAVKINLLKNI
jgi:hypothetical protein